MGLLNLMDTIGNPRLKAGVFILALSIQIGESDYDAIKIRLHKSESDYICILMQ